MSITPTHVFGQDAKQYAQSHGWPNAVIIEGDSLNVKEGAKGDTPENRRIVLITPKSSPYDGVAQGLGARRYCTVLGAPEERPMLRRGILSVGKTRDFLVSNLELIDNPIAPGSFATDGACSVTIEDCYLHSWARHANGYGAGNELMEVPLSHTIRRTIFDSCGAYSNLRHAIYIGSRAHSTATVEDCEFRGARGCSQLKSKCNENFIRRTKFFTHGLTSEMTPNSMIDIPACCHAVVSGNEFHIWRGDRKVIPAGYNGLITSPIHWRLRLSLDGSDIPAYPREKYYPEIIQTEGHLMQVAVVSPGNDWPPGPETFDDPAFWADVARYQMQDPANPFTFRKYISNNQFSYDPGNVEEKSILRDDGTLPIAEYGQGSAAGVQIYVPNEWRERSVSFLCANRLLGNFLPPRLQAKQPIEYPMEDPFERTLPEHFPQVFEVAPVMAPPAWFAQ